MRLIDCYYHFSRYHAKSRTYLYRLAIAKDYYVKKGFRTRANFWNYIPIEEIHRCWFLAQPEINIDRIKEKSQIFLGRHDFRTFMNAQRKNARDHPMFCIRSIDSIDIYPGQALQTSGGCEKRELYNYWDIKIKGRSFLYKQVRRIVGCLVSYGHGKVSDKDVYEMLTIPSKNSWTPRIALAPAHGLYLCNVEYLPEDLELSRNEFIGCSEVEEGQIEADRDKSQVC